jgi:hypothetical protein
MNIILMSGGEGTRWGNHGGVPKHLFCPDGEESILDRQVRLFAPYGNVIIVSGDPRYERAGTRRVMPERVQTNTDKFLAATKHWSPTWRTLLVYGDVWFDEEDADEIACDNFDGWRWYGVTFNPVGRYIGEMLALSFWPEHRQKVLSDMNNVNALERGGLTVGGGWRAARLMAGLDCESVHIHEGLTLPHYMDFRSWSTDFDYPQHYERWVKDQQ